MSYQAQRGLYLHPTYVVSPEREPLGVFNAWTWARQFKAEGGTRAGLCESTRWIESYERIAQSAQALPGGGKLWDKVMEQEALGRIRFMLPAGRGRKSRTVEQDIRVQRIALSDKAKGVDLVDFCNLATTLVVNQQVVGGYFLVEQHGLGFASVGKGIQVNKALDIHRANLAMQIASQAIRLGLVNLQQLQVQKSAH